VSERTHDAGRGLTPRQVARLLRCSKDKVRALIRSGELGAVTTPGRPGRPRYVVWPEHLQAYERAHRVSTPPKPARRCQRLATPKDYYPD
jgi:excisionase family DNA binding protein